MEKIYSSKRTEIVDDLWKMDSWNVLNPKARLVTRLNASMRLFLRLIFLSSEKQKKWNRIFNRKSIVVKLTHGHIWFVCEVNLLHDCRRDRNWESIRRFIIHANVNRNGCLDGGPTVWWISRYSSKTRIRVIYTLNYAIPYRNAPSTTPNTVSNCQRPKRA